MRAKPGKIEVEEGIEELKMVLAADGSWARETGTRKTPLDAYGHITLRMKAVSYTHLRAHETPEHLVCPLQD